MTQTSVSVVIPVYNEEQSIEKTAATLATILDGATESYEIIYVNDGSTDRTEKILTKIAEDTPSANVLHLSRNFGKEAALSAGLERARGDCIIFADADLQHPPELIPEMLRQWNAGFDVVNARKVERARETLGNRLSAGIFNWCMSKVLGRDFSGASDFKLIDRQVADALLQCPERNRFFRGLVTWVGFEATDVEFEVPQREAGDTKWSSWELLRYSISNLVAFSSLPLELVAYTGFVTVGIGTILLLDTLYNFVTGNAAIGFTTVIAVQILLGGLILASLGVIALYMAKMYQEQKQRPLFIVKKPAPDRCSERPADSARGNE